MTENCKGCKQLTHRNGHTYGPVNSREDVWPHRNKKLRYTILNTNLKKKLKYLMTSNTGKEVGEHTLIHYWMEWQLVKLIKKVICQ